MKGLRLPRVGGIPGVDIVTILQEALAGMDIKQLHEKIGIDGIFWKLVDEGVIQVHQFKPGQFSYTIGDEIFHTPEDAWRTVVRSVPFCTSIEEKEWQKGRTLQDTFESASFQQKLGDVAIVTTNVLKEKLGTEEKRIQDKKTAMDAAPEDARWRDEGLTPADSRPLVHATPLPEYDYTQEGFDPSVVGIPVLEGYQVATDALDTSILDSKVHIGYHKLNSVTGQVYTGRTSGEGDINNERDLRRLLDNRDRTHHMNKFGYRKAEIQVVSTAAEAIRGWEQRAIDINGGAQSKGGTSGNRINGVSDQNPRKVEYDNAFKKEFGGGQ